MLNQSAWFTADADGLNPIITPSVKNTPLATVDSTGKWVEDANGVVMGNVIFDHAFGQVNGPAAYNQGRMQNVGINSLTTKIGDLTFQNLKADVRIYPQNHNGTTGNTGYENINSALTGSGGKVIDASIYYTGDTSTAGSVRSTNYAIRTFEMENLIYAGHTTNTLAYNVSFNSQTDANLYRQAIKVNGSVILGNAESNGYGTLWFGANNGSINGTTASHKWAAIHSLTVAGNFTMRGEVLSNWNVYKDMTRTMADINFDKAGYYTGTQADVIISGIVDMTGAGSLWPNLHLNNINGAYHTTIPGDLYNYSTINTVYRVGGLKGNGNIENGQYSNGTVVFVLNNSENLSYSGVMTDNKLYSSVESKMTMKVVMAGSENGRQVMTQTHLPDTYGWRGGVEIVSGTLAMHTANEALFKQGDLTISGGRLEIIKNQYASFLNARFVANDFYWSGGKVKTEFLDSGVHDSIALMEFAGGVYLDAGVDNYIFEFSNVLDAGTYLIMQWEDNSLTKADESKFKAIASGWDVTFEIDEVAHTLSATFVIPEPSTVAALMGLCVLLFTIVRRRK